MAGRVRAETIPRRMLFSFLYVAVRRLLELLVLGRRSEADKNLEIVVLRHELAALRRQVKLPQFRPSDRVFLAVAARVLSRKRWADAAIIHSPMPRRPASR